MHRGQQVPVTEFLIRKSGRQAGQYRSACRKCESRQVMVRRYEREGRPSQKVEITPLWKNAVQELIFRVGKAETARRIGRTHAWLCAFQKGTYRHMQRKTAKAILTVLIEARVKGEARHKFSIRTGHAARGLPELIPTNRKHFNGPDNAERERRQNWSKENPERQREIEIRRNKLRRERSAQRRQMAA